MRLEGHNYLRDRPAPSDKSRPQALFLARDLLSLSYLWFCQYDALALGIHSRIRVLPVIPSFVRSQHQFPPVLHLLDTALQEPPTHISK